jgi:xylulokinase
MNDRPCFMGIDIGTGSAKGVITDSTGTVLAASVLPHSVSSPEPGWYEQDADEVWWHAVKVLSGRLIQDLPSGYAIRALCCSAIAPCVLPVDRQGTPLRPGILYGIDTRAHKEIGELTEEIGAQQIFAMTGQQLSSQSCCPKILWIARNEPQVYERTHKLLTATGYVNFRLTGRYSVDIYDGIGYAPLFNIHTRQWDRTYEQQVCPVELLPELLWSSSICGYVHAQAAEETGLPQGIPVMGGTADAAAESLAAGVTEAGDMMMMYGSSNFFIMRTHRLRPAASFWAAHFMQEPQTVLTGGMATVGSLFKWFSETFPGRSFAEWEELARSSQPGANGITILPYFAGERTPLFDPDAKGVIFGLSLRTTPGDIYQGLLEAVGFGIRHNLEVLHQQGEDAKRIIAIGGGSSSASLMQCVSNITGCVQQVPKQKLGACYGDAFLAAAGSGYAERMGGIEQWVDIATEYVPDPALKQRYDKTYSRFRTLYESTKDLL